MFLTDAAVLQSVADMLKQPAANLPAYWTNVVSEAHNSAYQEIVGRLVRRGFTLAQITSWDRGVEYERALTLFWSLTNGGGLAGLDDRFIKLFDRRAELDHVEVFVAGVWVRPGAAGGPGLIGNGGPDTSQDIFVFPDPTGQDLGNLTRW